jgi:tRNA nucleotidyltransferase (CCA-adding enzyme)
MMINVDNQIQNKIIKLAEKIKCFSGRAVFVGGIVRDELLNRQSKDIDIEVFGLKSYALLKEIAQEFGTVNEVGKAFAVLKLKLNDSVEIDLSFPRTESKIGPGHKGFNVVSDQQLSFYQAAKRRDFTINAISKDILTKELIDPFNGVADLKNKRLVHVSNQFSEDPLRVFRAAQFMARFNLDVSPKTKSICKQMPIDELPKERVFEEMKKLVLKADKPSIGFEFLKDINALSYLPPLKALIGTPQDPTWHPEGDVWIHTMMVVDEMSKLKTTDEKKDIIFMLAALCHDLGKPLTTKKIDGRWKSHGHEEAGKVPAQEFLKCLTDDKSIINQVIPLVCHHMKPSMLYESQKKTKVSDAAIRRLSTKVPIQDLVRLSTADYLGRKKIKSLAFNYPAGQWLLDRARKLEVHTKAPACLLQGKDLIKLGVKPGKSLGKLLNNVYEKQLEGELKTKEDALKWVKLFV